MTENIFRLPDGEAAARKFRKNVDEVVEFLVGQFPLLLMRGADMERNEHENMYKYFSDNVKLELPDFEFRGRRAVERLCLYLSHFRKSRLHQYT